MTEDNEQRYAAFDEYLRQGEPSKREAAFAWSTAIGLLDVDRLKTSDYLREVAARNIEGEITIDEAHRLINSYYRKKTDRSADSEATEEADKAAANISRIPGQVPEQVPGQVPGQVPEQVTRTSTRTTSLVTHLNPNTKFYTDYENTLELVRVLGMDELTIKELMMRRSLKQRPNFIEYHLNPALRERFLRRKYPNNPNHPRQRYLLTVKGQMLYNELTKPTPP